jgi:hypothetical protein
MVPNLLSSYVCGSVYERLEVKATGNDPICCLERNWVYED